jgi:hypothetical protein
MGLWSALPLAAESTEPGAVAGPLRPAGVGVFVAGSGSRAGSGQMIVRMTWWAVLVRLIHMTW